MWQCCKTNEKTFEQRLEGDEKYISGRRAFCVEGTDSV